MRLNPPTKPFRVLPGLRFYPLANLFALFHPLPGQIEQHEIAQGPDQYPLLMFVNTAGLRLGSGK